VQVGALVRSVGDQTSKKWVAEDDGGSIVA
jgi:hypothetical protein